MTCDRCQQDATVGDHGIGLCPLERGRHRKSTIDATWAGGKTFENLAHEPKTFYSPSELHRYLKARNLEPFVRHQPVPGSDKSPHTTSWAAVSQATLDGAKAMLERVGQGRSAERQTYIRSMTVSITDVVEPARLDR